MTVLVVEQVGHGVLLLKINRPEAANALNTELRTGLLEVFTGAAEQESIRCVVVAGSDRVFAAGADLRMLATLRPAKLAASGSDNVYRALANFSKPVVAAVNGPAFGGGCELAMHCDIIIAGESAKFAQPEIKVGIMPGGGGTQRLIRAIGKFKAMKLLLTGDPVSATEAERMGLVSEVVLDEAVLDRALELARKIAALPPLAMRRLKQVTLQGADLPLDAALMLERQAFTLLFDTEDQKEGMRSFLEKRQPQFQGR